INAPRRLFVVDRSRIRLLDEPRPGRICIHSLPEREFRCGSRILDRFEVYGAHRFGRIAENSLSILAVCGRPSDHQHDREHYETYGFVAHKYLSNRVRLDAIGRQYSTSGNSGRAYRYLQNGSAKRIDIGGESNLDS